MYALSEHRSYGQLRDELIRNKIVVGLRDEKLSERLQLDADLTLKKAVDQARQSEAVKKQQTLLRNNFQEADADAIHRERSTSSLETQTRNQEVPEHFQLRNTVKQEEQPVWQMWPRTP